MEQITSFFRENQSVLANCLAFFSEKPDNLCFFDIETTGLSPAISSLYLIGAAVWDNDGFQIVQWFADDYVSEKELLLAFASFSASCTAFVHYNGASFDIPYLEKKYARYHLPSPFQGKTSIDLYRSLPKNKSFFSVPNRQLTSMEKLLHFHRTDTFTGKECIQLYTEFMHKKYFRDPAAKERKKQLARHNLEDIQGTVLCAQLLSYVYGVFSPLCVEQILPEKETSPWLLKGQLAHGYFPVNSQSAWTLAENEICCRYEQNTLSVEISPFYGMLYHYFKDYKDYFYLPREDTAIHKSVGAYVDRQYRRPATASTCYIKKQGSFFALPKNFPSENIPLFRETHKSRQLYIEASSLSSLSENQLIYLLNSFRGK